MASKPEPLGAVAKAAGLCIPRHLGVTMDGNGRWAAARGKPRTDGHSEGVKALRRLVEYCIIYGIEYLTVFSFSSENWSRPAGEIRFIFSLLHRFVESDLETLQRNNVRVRVIGSRQRLDKNILSLIERVETRTAHCTGLKLQVAFNYGGRHEIVDAARELARKVRDGELPLDSIDEQVFANALSTAEFPDPDVILRTSGEYRFSNFLIWQAAYAELVFVDTLWPDFDETVFIKVLEDYSRRERRYGGIGAVAK